MSCTNIDNIARAYDAHAASAPEHPADTEKPRAYLAAVQDYSGPTPVVNHAPRGRSNRVFGVLVGAGLAILIVVLAVVLSAASHVEVLP